METLPSGLPESVADAEDLARFLPQSNYFNQAGVKPVAFLPNPKNLETSVFRHGGDAVPNLRRIGEENIGGGRTIYGTAFLKALMFARQCFRFSPANPLPATRILWVGLVTKIRKWKKPNGKTWPTSFPSTQFYCDSSQNVCFPQLPTSGSFFPLHLTFPHPGLLSNTHLRGS